MLDYGCCILLNTPLRVLIVALAAGVVGGIFGWYDVSPKVAAVWTHIAARAATGGQGAYRAPLRTVTIQRTPLLVHATAFTSYALYPGHAGCILVFINAVFWGVPRLAVIAIGLFGVGAAMAYGAHVLVTRGIAGFLTLRRRIMSAAILVFVAHGTVALVLAAVMMGAFDGLSFELRGIKGTTTSMRLGEIRELLPSQPILLFTGGHSLVTWQALGFGALVYAWASLINAALVLVLARVVGGSSDGRRAAPSPFPIHARAGGPIRILSPGRGAAPPRRW